MLIRTPGNARLCVANSPIHGKGLFALDLIRKDDLLGVIKGIHIYSDDMYAIWLTQHHAVRILCKFKYINHSDDPNIILYDTLEVCALRDIQAGEEILHNYESGDWLEE